MIHHQLPVGIQDAIYRWGGGRPTKFLGMINLLCWVLEKTFTLIEVHSDMAERLVGDLEILEYLQIEIKSAISKNNQSYVQWCSLSYD